MLQINNNRILFLPYSEQLGTLLRDIEIAKSLRMNFSKEIFFGCSGVYADLVKRHGFTVYSLAEVPFNKYRNHVDNANLDIYTFTELSEFVKAEIDLIRQIDPAVIIADTRWSSFISSRLTKKPLINIVSATLTPYSQLYTTIPTSHKLYKYRFLLSPLTKLIKKIYFGTWVKQYNILLKKYNLSTRRSLFDIMLGDYTIIPDFPELIPIKNTPKNVHVVGGIVLNSLVESPKWLEKLDRRKTIIYLSFGSTGLKYDNILQYCIELFGDKPDYQVITNYTEISDKQNKNIMPKNFFVEKFLSADEILTFTDLMINHGGTGVINHALLAGVPVLCIPHQGEQEWNSYNIKRLRLGDFIFIKDINKNVLQKKISKILSDTNIKNNVLVLKSKILKHKPIEKTTEIIISIIKNENNKEKN